MSSERDTPCHIQAKNLVIRRGRRLVCEMPLLGMESGQIVWLRGRNGSGKSSVLRALAGLLPVDQGQITRCGHRPLYLGHQNALHEELTLLENLQFLSTLNGEPFSTDQLQQVIQQWQLDSHAHQLVRRLSQGLKRRTALARLSFGRGARCWLLDEPYDALDQAACRRLGQSMAEHAAHGGAVMFTSHSHPEGLTHSYTEVWMHV